MDMIEPKYFSMAYVCARFGIPASMVRFWIDEFSLPVKCNKTNKRFFTWDDVEKIGEIYYLLKVRKFTSEGARQEMEPEHMRMEMHNMLRVF